VRAIVPRGLALAVAMATAGSITQTQVRPCGLPACAGFSEREVASLADGAVLARTLPPANSHEVVVAGAVRIAVPAAFYAERFEDIATFKPGGPVLQAGRFSAPPQLSDLDALAIDRRDVNELRECRARDCGLKLSSAAIDRFQSDVHWNRPDHADEAARLMKVMLHDYATAYLRAGGHALGAYDDKAVSVSLGGGFRTLLDGASCFSSIAPDLFRYLAHHPRVGLPGSRSFLYWSKEDFGLKPVISLTHAVIHQPNPESPILIASRGLYSSHYVEASLGITVLIEGAAAGAPYVDVYYVNRSRTDTLRGGFRSLARSIVGGRQRSGMTQELAALKVRVEAAWRSIDVPRAPHPLIRSR
jgi:hypothetical protein